MKQSRKNGAAKRSAGISARVKKGLDKYSGEILFPEKVAKANKLLKGVKLPVR